MAKKFPTNFLHKVRNEITEELQKGSLQSSQASWKICMRYTRGHTPDARKLESAIARQKNKEINRKKETPTHSKKPLVNPTNIERLERLLCMSYGDILAGAKAHELEQPEDSYTSSL